MKRKEFMDCQDESNIYQMEQRRILFEESFKRRKTGENSQENLVNSGQLTHVDEGASDYDICQRELTKMLNLLEVDTITREQSWRLVSEALKAREAAGSSVRSLRIHTHPEACIS